MDYQNNLEHQPEEGAQSAEQPPKRCVRCGSPLHGPFCSLCGLPESAASARYIPVSAPTHKKRKTSTVLLIVLAAVVGLALLVGGCTALFLVADRAGTLEPYREDSFDSSPYESFGFEFGYNNETRDIRVDALGTQRSTGSTEFPAPEGREYLIVNLRITNLGNDIITYDTADFEVSTGRGNLVPAQYTDIDASTALGYGRLLPTGEVEGSVVFLVPKGELNLVLYMSDYETTISFPLL
ncbi:DUF4352 domain-containing protein [Hydrogenoanaerobacterium sp.]|uniref:DUF4352 domain-containing protein n=1 Tax=Hydrogenoanaerobacterium sp. TaxID=2953763 RepID=UPI0028A16922|nr:DUF4352 domain-containing protein [Hydrogenoanaerobacterium sp.]